MAASPAKNRPSITVPGTWAKGKSLMMRPHGGVVGLGPADHAPGAVALEDDRLVHDDRLAVRGGQHVDEVAGGGGVDGGLDGLVRCAGRARRPDRRVGPSARTWNVSPVRVVAPSAVTASW